MKILTYKFTGISPLLMANIESVNRKVPQLKIGTKPNKDDIKIIAEAMTYRNEDNKFYMPTQALRSSLLKGCVGMKFPGTRQGPASIFQALVFPAEEKATLLNANGKPLKRYEIQIDSGVNKSTKSRIIIVRPRFDSWSMVVPFEIDDEFAPSNFDEFLDALLRIWNRAGRTAGIGAWRPECKGRHGRYDVELV